MKKCNVAIAQMDIKAGDKEANLETISELVSRASKEGANFVCLPEYVSTGSDFENFGDLAEHISGNVVNKLGEIAKENGVYLVASIAEKAEENFHNTAVILGPTGDLLAKHRKMHLFLDEQEHVTTGSEFAVAETEFGKIGLMVCYDVIFPEVARELALQGVEILFLPANWPEPFIQQWRIATSARALDNQLWLVATNRVGKDDKFTYFGGSRVVSPYGDAVIECGDSKEVVVGTMDGGAAQGFKNIVDFLGDRRQQNYD